MKKFTNSLKAKSITRHLKGMALLLFLSLATHAQDSNKVKYAPVTIIDEDEQEDSTITSNKSKAGVATSTAEKSCIDIALNPVYATFAVTNQKDLIYTLYKYYSYDKKKYEETRASSGLGAMLPSYGSGSYKKSKGEVTTLYQKYQTLTSVNLSLQEHQTITNTFVDRDVALAMYQAVTTCLEITNARPRLELVGSSKEEVVFNLVLPHDRFKRTKLLSAASPQLEFNKIKSSARVGKNVKYGSTYSLVFTRKSKDAGNLSVAVEGHTPLTESFDAADSPKVPVYAWLWRSADDAGNAYEMKAYLQPNAKNKRIYTIGADGVQTETVWNRKAPIKATINTALDRDSIWISAIHPAYNANIKSHNTPVVVMAAGSNLQNIYVELVPGKKPSWVTYTIYYKKRVLRCIENCGDEVELADANEDL